MAAIAETMEILANPAAMKAIRSAEAGRGRNYPAPIFRSELSLTVKKQVMDFAAGLAPEPPQGTQEGDSRVG